MKVFASFNAPGTRAAAAPSHATTAAVSPDAAVKACRTAVKQHKKALKELCACMENFTHALAAVATSLHQLAANTRAPVTIQCSGALVRGVEEVRDGVVLQDLMEELEYALSTRFEKLAEEQRDLDERRKRRCKAERTLTALQTQCARLRHAKDGDAKAQALHRAETQRCEEQHLECVRLRSEFDDAFHDFTSHLGQLVYEDMKGLTEELHKVLSALAYQHRKCEEALVVHHPTTLRPIAVVA
ncbi:hypothetical protein NESM_000613900 [Novymonas esmeraldas]|uniref:BAR domain-containing protein n=1 Tax=Novymonas esmeraldas TaxID=1808958 RepID=A0AAW0ET07_9TRYP